MDALRRKRFSILETVGLAALGMWLVQGIAHALSIPGIAAGQVAHAADIQQIVDHLESQTKMLAI